MPRSTLFGDAYFDDTEDLFMSDEDRIEQAYPGYAGGTWQFRPVPRAMCITPARAEDFGIVPDDDEPIA